MRPPYRGDVDGLRAIAVLLVVAFHAFPRKVPGGFVGVDIFFVISGFLITSLILRSKENGDFSFADFYARRIKRIFPALIVVLAACLAAGWFVMFPGEYRDLGKHSGAGAGFVANFSFLQEVGYFDVASDHKPLLHLWSLGIEEQFYIVWPALIVLVWRWRNGPLAMACLICLVSFVWNIVLTRTNLSQAFYLPFTRFWELMIGCIIAFAGSHGSPPAHFPRLASIYQRHRDTLHNAAGWLGIALIAVATALINAERSFPGWWALLPTGGAALLILAGPQASINRRLLSHRALVYVGLISYPLYLWHWPLLAYARIIHLREPTVLMKIACIAAAMALADLTYRYIEKPIRFGVPVAAKPVMASIALAVIGCFGLLIYLKDGFPSRFPEEMQSLVSQSWSDPAEDFRQYRCLIGDEAGAAFDAACDGVAQPGARKIVLWGDSHATALGPGLEELRRRGPNFQLAQYTASGCPPVLQLVSEQRKNCQSINEAIIKKIAQLMPDTVILAGRWELYDQSGGWGRVEASSLQATIAQLRSMSVGRIVVVGQFPTWGAMVPKIRTRSYRMAGFAGAETPSAIERDKSYLKITIGPANERIRQAAVGAVFISPLSTLCNDQGCLLVVPDGSGKPMAWDESHMTRSGSIYFVTSNAAAFVGP